MNNVINKRLKRLKNGKGKFVLIPMDHGMTNGPVPGIKDIENAVRNLIGSGVTGFILHKGMARHIVGYLENEGLIIHLSGGNALSPHVNKKVMVTDVESAIAAGADAVSVHVNVGNSDDLDMISDLGEVVDRAHYYGIPVLAMMYARGENIKDQYDPQNIQIIARVADEAGADLVKVYYTGSVDSFRQVVSGVRIPVLIAGGPKLDSEDRFVDMVRDSMLAGASGISIGRNIWQSTDPRAIVKRILEVMG